MIGSNFIFDCVNLLRYKCDKTNLKQGGSYTNSYDWTKKNKRFHYTVIVMLHDKEIEINCQGCKNFSLLEMNITRKE